MGAVTLAQIVNGTEPTVAVDAHGVTVTYKYLRAYKKPIPKEDISFVDVDCLRGHLGKRPKTGRADQLRMHARDMRVLIGTGHTLMVFGGNLPYGELQWMKDAISGILWPYGAPDPEMDLPRPQEAVTHRATQTATITPVALLILGVICRTCPSWNRRRGC